MILGSGTFSLRMSQMTHTYFVFQVYNIILWRILYCFVLQQETRKVYNLLAEDVEANFSGWKTEPGHVARCTFSIHWVKM